MDIGAIIERAYLLTIGSSVFVGLMGFALYRHSWRWRQLAVRHAALGADRPDREHWTNLVLEGGPFGWNNYGGVTLIGVNARGMTVRLLPPFSVFHRPLFFRFDQVAIAPTRWLFQDAYETQLPDSSGIRIVINGVAARWIEKNGGPAVRSMAAGVQVA
jgi:hypothetical protein